MAEAVSLRYMTAEDPIQLDSVYLLILMVKLAPGLVFSYYFVSIFAVVQSNCH
jgi:hypothetical protein